MNVQDDMGSIKIEDIVDAIMMNEAAKNIRQQVSVGLGLGNEIGMDEDDDEDGVIVENGKDETTDAEYDGHYEFEHMGELEVADLVTDPNSAPFKPVYALTN